MTAQELITKYNITLKWELTDNGYGPNGKIIIRNGEECAQAGDRETIRAMKPEILSILMAEYNAEKERYQERKAKIKAIPGLEEITSALEDANSWHRDLEASFDGESGGGIGVRAKPKYDFDAMYAKYPRAKAYLDAKQFAEANNYAKAAAGNKALEAIINGDDYNDAIATMIAEWDAYLAKNMWD